MSLNCHQYFITAYHVVCLNRDSYVPSPNLNNNGQSRHKTVTPVIACFRTTPHWPETGRTQHYRTQPQFRSASFTLASTASVPNFNQINRHVVETVQTTIEGTSAPFILTFLTVSVAERQTATSVMSLNCPTARNNSTPRPYLITRAATDNQASKLWGSSCR